jgi:hypothetical protein
MREEERKAVKKILSMIFVVMVAIAGAGGGCKEDSTEPEMDRCERKGFACRNSCYKAGLGAACFACCAENTIMQFGCRKL